MRTTSKIQAVQCDRCSDRWIVEHPTPKKTADLTFRFKGKSYCFRDLCVVCLKLAEQNLEDFTSKKAEISPRYEGA